MTDSNYVVDAFIEIPKYSSNKYEFDVKTGRFRLDRTLYSKDLEEKETHVIGWEDRERAIKEIENGRAAHLDRQRA